MFGCKKIKEKKIKRKIIQINKNYVKNKLIQSKNFNKIMKKILYRNKIQNYTKDKQMKSVIHYK